MNDLANFEEIRRRNVAMEARRDPSLLKVVGDGGFRSGVPGRTRQSGSDPLDKLATFELDQAKGKEGRENLLISRQTTMRHGSFLFPPEPAASATTEQQQAAAAAAAMRRTAPPAGRLQL